MAENLLNNINPNFFEGVEKLLEIWFAPSANADLRKIPRYASPLEFRGIFPPEVVQKILILAKYRFLPLEIISAFCILENERSAHLNLHTQVNDISRAAFSPLQFLFDADLFMAQKIMQLNRSEK